MAFRTESLRFKGGVIVCILFFFSLAFYDKYLYMIVIYRFFLWWVFQKKNNVCRIYIYIIIFRYLYAFLRSLSVRLYIYICITIKVELCECLIDSVESFYSHVIKK